MASIWRASMRRNAACETFCALRSMVAYVSVHVFEGYREAERSARTERSMRSSFTEFSPARMLAT